MHVCATCNQLYLALFLFSLLLLLEFLRQFGAYIYLLTIITPKLSVILFLAGKCVCIQIEIPLHQGCHVTLTLKNIFKEEFTQLSLYAHNSEGSGILLEWELRLA